MLKKMPPKRRRFFRSRPIKIASLFKSIKFDFNRIIIFKMNTHAFKALVALFAVFACGSTGNVRAESFGISGFDTWDFDNDNYGDYQAARPAQSAIGSGNAYFADFRYDPS
jgi:hypothetical protein